MNGSFHTLLRYSQVLAPYCTQWTNALIASQYLTPFQILSQYDSTPHLTQVLDWGCGDGHFSYFLTQRGNQVEAFSFSDIAAYPVLNTSFQWTRGSHDKPSQLPYSNSSFDLICSVGVLEHVRETGGQEILSLQELYRILKPGGQVFVFHFPNRHSWIEKVNRRWNKKKYTHPFLYNAADIQYLAHQTGFTLIEQGLYNLLPRNCFRSLPLKWGNHPVIVAVYQWLEKILAIPFARYAQNHYAVLRKPLT